MPTSYQIPMLHLDHQNQTPVIHELHLYLCPSSSSVAILPSSPQHLTPPNPDASPRPSNPASPPPAPAADDSKPAPPSSETASPAPTPSTTPPYLGNTAP